MNIRIDINVCRVCLQASDGVSIFSDDILEKFLFTTLVQVEEGDGLPQILCQKCLSRLRLSYAFKKQSEASDKHLRSFISDVNRKFELVRKVDVDDQINDETNDIDNDMILFDSLSGDDSQDVIEEEHKVLANDDVDGDVVEELEENLVDQTNDENLKMEVLIVNDNDLELNEEDLSSDFQVIEDFAKNDDTMVDSELNDYEQVYEEHLEQNNESEATPSAETKRSGKTRRQWKKATRSPKAETGENYCTKCDKVYSTKTNLTRHMVTHNGNKPYVCHLCGNSFTQNGSLKSHMFIHTGERPYACHLCPKAFTQSKSLTFHMRRHTGEKPFTCSECGMDFRQKDGLKRHMRTKHSTEPPKPMPCEICGKLLSSKHSLRIHLKKHNIHKDTSDASQDAQKSSQESSDEGTLYKCQICETHFIEKSALYTHYTDVHQKEVVQTTVYKCNQCDDEFESLELLMGHARKHGQKSEEEEVDFVTSFVAE